jgi:hypothetical protein
LCTSHALEEVFAATRRKVRGWVFLLIVLKSILGYNNLYFLKILLCYFSFSFINTAFPMVLFLVGFCIQ